MALTTSDDNELGLIEAACYFRRSGSQPGVKTIRRWIVEGLGGVHLRAYKYGAAWVTTPRFIDQFKRECTARALKADALPRVQEPAATPEQLADSGPAIEVQELCITCAQLGRRSAAKNCGLCRACYCAFRRAVKANAISAEDAIRRGLARPPKRAGRKVKNPFGLQAGIGKR
jgi:hypothetical protein